MRNASVLLVAAAFVSASAYLTEPHQTKPAAHKALLSVKGGAPAGAPGAAPGPAGPPAPKDSWGADTHADEFGKEYIHHTREGLKEPHVGDAAWQSEMHANVANFDPHGQDFVTDRRSPAKPMLGSAGRFTTSVAAVVLPALFAMVQ